jgi:hypothetical protein
MAEHRRISRREALHRGAVVGAGALWVAPVINPLSVSKAFAQSPSAPPPPPPPPPPDIEYPSNVTLLVRSGGVTYGVKFDEGDAPHWGAIPPAGALCTNGLASTTSQAVVDLFNAQVAVTKGVTAGGDGTYTLTLPAGFTLVYGAAKVGTACVAGALVSGTTYVFG